MQAFIALIRPNQNGGFLVDFPDFPECTTAGETLRHARLLAEATLSAHLEGLRKAGMEIPEPSCLKDIVQHDPANAQAMSLLVAV